MLKLMAVLRTLFLIFGVGYTVRAMPWSFDLPSGTAEAYDVCRRSLTLLGRAAWLALGWIAFETAVGWWMATRHPKVATGGAARGEPPFAPPPRAP